MTTRRFAAFAVTAAVFVSGSGCAFKERKERADFLVSAASRVQGVQTATGTLTMSTVVVLPESAQREQQEQSGGLQIPGLDQATRPVVVRYQAGIDFANQTTALGLTPTDETPFAIYQESRIFIRRSGRGTERRPWATIDFDDIDPRDVEDSEANPVVGFLAFNPTVITELVAGALSGSIEKIGTATVAGVPTTHYRANIDWEKMVRAPDREYAGLEELTDEQEETRQVVYDSMQIRDTLFEDGEIWLDEQGIPRRIQMAIDQRFRQEGQNSRRLRTETTVTLELAQTNVPVSVAVPDRSEVVRVDSYGALMREATRGQQAPEGQQLQVPVPNASYPQAGDGAVPQFGPGGPALQQPDPGAGG